jgi:6-methylsalicylate decarboxylase
MAKELNIQKSILSISSPGVHLVPSDNQKARQVCRDCNTYAADLKKRMPDHFGFWATIPLPDIEGSLEEIAWALDDLNADGIAVETNHHGHYLGHESFEPVWAALDRRRAIVFIHPTCAHALETKTDSAGSATSSKPSPTPAIPLPQYPLPIFEYFFDTARAVINLFYSGAIARYPNITYIVPHAGGCLPPLIERFSLFGRLIPGLPVDKSADPTFVKDRLRKQFYFDMAGAPWPDQMRGLMSYIEVKQLLYGSDYPFTHGPGVKMLAASMETHMKDLFEDAEDRDLTYRANAQRLLDGRGLGSSL